MTADLYPVAFDATHDHRDWETNDHDQPTDQDVADDTDLFSPTYLQLKAAHDAAFDRYGYGHPAEVAALHALDRYLDIDDGGDAA